MATIDKAQGKIKDRTVGYKPMYYRVGNKSKKFLETCLKAHEAIIDVLTPQARESITSKEMKSAVLTYIAIDDSGKKELLKKITLSGYGTKNEKPEASLEQLAEAWFEQKAAQGVTDKQRSTMLGQKMVILDFFNGQGFETTTDLKPDTAHKFLAWRSETNYSGRQTAISASTMKHNLQVLKQMAKIAARNGWFANPTIWDDVEVKSIAGVNTKIVEPLSVDLQKNVLERLRKMRSELHDSILFLLLTGIRLGELENLTPESIRGNAIILHGEAVGHIKPSSGKTASAARTLPICPTAAKIFERCYVFKTATKNIRQAVKRYSFAKEFPGIHPID
jgi:integrase